MKSLFVPHSLRHSSCPLAFFSSSLLFPSVVGCQPGPRRKSKLKRQMRAVTSQGWGGTERAAWPPAPWPAGGGTARHTGAPGTLGPWGDACLYFEEKKSFSVLLVLCRGGSRAAKCFPACIPVTAWSQRLARDISQRNSCRRLGFEVEKGSGDQAVETNNVPGQQNRQWSWRGQDYCCHSLLT